MKSSFRMTPYRKGWHRWRGWLLAILALALPGIGAGTASGQDAASEEGVIEGRVLDQELSPALGVRVEIVDLARTTETDGEGRFRFPEVPAGRYVLRAETADRGTAVERVVVSGGDVVETTLSLNPAFHLDQLVVTASPTAATREELFQAVEALSGRRLRSRVRASLGQTLADEPGVSASYFGPASSRPVIRGLGGDRVRILEGGIGTGDASNTSPDHAVSVETQQAERIEVVRGPATLLYGSSAIGGVVNVLDGRIPSSRPYGGVEGEIRTLGASAGSELMASGDLTAGFGSWAVTGSALVRDTDDFEIPGFAEELHEGETRDPEAVPGILPNSALSTSRLSGGLSWIGDDGHIGLSVSGYDSEYGVPGHGHHHEEGEAGGGETPAGEEHAGEHAGEHAEEVAIDLSQRRLDLEGEWRFGAAASEGLRTVRGRFGVTDYEHVELEGEEVGTRFGNDEWEGRFEVQHGLFGLDGALGVQGGRRDFSAIGEEAFVPPTETDHAALFAFEEAQMGPVRLQVGARAEWQRSTDRTRGFEESFSGSSISAGINWQTSDDATLAFSLSRSTKIPTPEELFSDGPHLATRAYEVGDRNLGTEVGTSFDGTLHIHGDRVEAQISAFANRFDGFIYPRFTGEEMEELQVLRYSQGDASFRGFEGRADVELFHRGSVHLVWEVSMDHVRATLDDTDDPLPRIPPFRMGSGLALEGGGWNAAVRVRRVSDQDRVAEFEEPTEGYTTLSAEVGYRRTVGGTVHEIVLTGENLTDAEARNHISLLKEVAPLPGRDLRLMYRWAF